MPFKSEKVKLAGTKYDLRRKLSDEQVRAVSILSAQGYSYRQLATMFGCSKSTIQNILHPFKRAAQKVRPTEYWTEAKRRYRARKNQLYKSGALTKKRRATNKKADEKV
jgi:transposase